MKFSSKTLHYTSVVPSETENPNTRNASQKKYLMTRRISNLYDSAVSKQEFLKFFFD